MATKAVLAAQEGATAASVNNAAALCSLPTNNTIEFWCLYPPGPTNLMLMGCMNDAQSMGWNIRVTTGSVPQFTWWDGVTNKAGPVAAITPFDRLWHHFAFVKSGTSLQTYVDGVLYASGSVTGTGAISTSSQPFGIGRHGGTQNPAQGLFSDVRIWHVARTQAAIQSDMNSRLLGTEANLAAYWPLDEGTGQSIPDKVGGLILQLNHGVWVTDDMPPLPYDPDGGGGGGGITISDLDNGLAEWLSASDGTHLDSAPLRLDTKFDHDGITIDAKLGVIAAELSLTREGLEHQFAILSGEEPEPPGSTATTNPDLLARLNQHDADIKARLPEGPALTPGDLDAAEERIVKQLSGHEDYSAGDSVDAGWSITEDVNAHSDALTVLLQGDLNDHEASTVAAVNTHTTLEGTKTTDTVNDHTTEEVDGLGTALTQHDASTAAYVNQAEANIISHIDAVQEADQDSLDEAMDRINTHTTAEATRVVTVVNEQSADVFNHVTESHAATRAHVTTEANRVIDALPEGGGVTDSDLASAVGQINGHTTGEANRVIGSLTGVIAAATAEINAAIAASAAVLATVQTATTVIITTTQSIFDRVLQITGIVLEVLALVTLLWENIQRIIPGAGTLTEVGSASWTDVFEFPVAAELYEVTVTTWPATLRVGSLTDGSHLGYVGWMALRSAQGYAPGEKLHFTHQAVPVGGILATGLLIHSKTGTAGTVKAFRRM